MGFFNQLKNQVARELKKSVLGDKDSEPLTKDAFEANKPDELRKDIRMISGCADHQTSADVSNVSNFCLPGELVTVRFYVYSFFLAMVVESNCTDAYPLFHRIKHKNIIDPAGRAGGALTSTLLKILYADEKTPEEDLSFTQVLTSVRQHLKKDRYSQIPQLSSMNPIDLETKFDLVPETATGTRRAVMIGINYVGEYLAMCIFVV